MAGTRSYAAVGSTWVIAGEIHLRTEDGDIDSHGAIWRSDAGGRWETVLEVDDGWVSGIAPRGLGFVAVGTVGGRAAVWQSSDGRSWRSVEDAAFTGGRMFEVGVSESGIVAFGDVGEDVTAAIWTSPDGTSWLRATNASGLEVAADLQELIALDGRMTAFVGPWQGRPSGVEVWTTTGRAEWHKVGSLPRSDEARIVNATRGPRGWVAVGRSTRAPFGPGLAWRSEDGEAWQRVAGGPDAADALLADEVGFIASGFIGSLPGETCGDPRDFQAQTWTSTDGRSWRQMPLDDSFDQAAVAALFLDDRTLTGIGLRHDDDGGFDPVAWTADLPAPSKDDAALSTPSATENGCGG